MQMQNNSKEQLKTPVQNGEEEEFENQWPLIVRDMWMTPFGGVWDHPDNHKCLPYSNWFPYRSLRYNHQSFYWYLDLYDSAPLLDHRAADYSIGCISQKTKAKRKT